MLNFQPMTKDEYKDKVIEKIEDNHIILNAIHYINPTQKMKIELANMILRMLNDKNNLLPDGMITNPIGAKLANKIPVLYLSISKS